MQLNKSFKYIEIARYLLEKKITGKFIISALNKISTYYLKLKLIKLAYNSLLYTLYFWFLYFFIYIYINIFPPSYQLIVMDTCWTYYNGCINTIPNWSSTCSICMVVWITYCKFSDSQKAF